MIKVIDRPAPASTDHLASLAIVRVALAHLEADRETCFTNAINRAIRETNLSGCTNDFEVAARLLPDTGAQFVAAEV